MVQKPTESIAPTKGLCHYKQKVSQNLESNAFFDNSDWLGLIFLQFLLLRWTNIITFEYYLNYLTIYSDLESWHACMDGTDLWKLLLGKKKKLNKIARVYHRIMHCICNLCTWCIDVCCSAPWQHCSLCSLTYTYSLFLRYSHLH